MKPSTRSTPIALTIAGSDSSGGAGIQADLKTFTVLGVYGASVITALTAQSTRGVVGIEPVTPAFIASQYRTVLADLDVKAMKTGMLGDRATVLAVAGLVRERGGVPLVVDPVMVATSGDALLAPQAVDAVRRELIPLADLITPNLPEAAALLDAKAARTVAEAEAQARALLAFGARAVLVKGGHGGSDTATDILVTREGARHFVLPRIETGNTHGTGCTLSAAVTAHLALGAGLADAVQRAKQFVWEALRSGRDLGVGRGCGPVDHMHALRRNDRV